MRKHHKQIISGIIESLGEANAEIQKVFFNKDTQTLSALLADCGDVAAQIGDYITQLDGEDVKTVKLLKEYADILNRINNESDDGYNLIKQLKKQTAVIVNSVKNDIKTDKLEVVFFPYKASMWDSLESIWLAAKNDPQCDAYVVPIPYYDKKTDGSFGKMHYEGGEYPDYVPVVDWQSYSLEERRPDIIFIHNPYDGNNYVTSVHPDYYAKRLKEFTNMLVYSPYFVTGETITENFCVLPGTIYADKVIVQSEKIRQEYINHFRKFEKDTDSVGKYGKTTEKFVALGSPKFDAIINKKREDFKMPDEWARLIDGKKVILYNTTVGAILKDDEQYLTKLRSVIEAFKERDDVVLWWRPHPLSVSTFETMRPQLASEYKQIVSEYKLDNFGIYDDTADLHRAIAWSDGYYGDGSSLVAMYEVTGKPVMYQKVDNKFDNNVAFDNLYDDGENFWFTAFHFNALFKMNKQTWEAEYMGSFPNEDFFKWRLYGQIAECDGKLYFAPFSANEIGVYEIKSGVFEKIVFKKPAIDINTKYYSYAKFNAITVNENYIFLMGSYYPAIIRIDTENGNIDYFTDWVKLLGESSNKDEPYFWKVYITGNQILLPVGKTNAVLEYDMCTGTSKIHRIGDNNNNYMDICFDGENYWVLSRKSKTIIKWNPDKNEYKEYNDYPYGFKYEEFGFAGIEYLDGFVWLIPAFANMAIKINVENDNVETADEFNVENDYAKEATAERNYLWFGMINDRIYTQKTQNNHFIEYDFKTNQRRVECIVLSEKEVLKIGKNIFLCPDYKNCNFHENSLLKLNSFLEYVLHDSIVKSNLSGRGAELLNNMIPNLGGECGIKTYEHIKSMVK